MNIIFGEIEKFLTDKHQTFSPFTLNFICFFLMNNWEHLSCHEDSINFKEALIEIFSLINCLFIIVSFSEFDIEGFVEAIDFIFHGSAKCIDLRFSHPVAVHVATTFIFEKIFELTSGRSDSSP